MTKKNETKIKHTYKIGDKVLLSKETEFKYEAPFSGPHEILEVNDNGTVCLQVIAVADNYNIRRLYLYYSATDPDHGGVCNMWTSMSKRRRLL
jgi:hypothetical protein